MTVLHPDTDLTYWSEDYWLGHCEGFRVGDGASRLGIVEAVVGPADEPEYLLVRGGLFANRVYMVSVDDVLEVEPRAQRILLRMDRDPAR